MLVYLDILKLQQNILPALLPLEQVLVLIFPLDTPDKRQTKEKSQLRENINLSLFLLLQQIKAVAFLLARHKNYCHVLFAIAFLAKTKRPEQC